MHERHREDARTALLGRDLHVAPARSHTGITVSYWESEDAIRQWKRNAEHLEAQRRGRAEWYESFVVRVCRVERAYGQPDLTQRL
jgi:heme-degrading monooxygenase HmoA